MVRHILFWRFSQAVTPENRAEVFDHPDEARMRYPD